MSTPRRRQPRRVVDANTSVELAAIVDEISQMYAAGGLLQDVEGGLREIARRTAEADPCVREVPRGVAPTDEMDIPDPAPGLARSVARAAARRRQRAVEIAEADPEATREMARRRRRAELGDPDETARMSDGVVRAALRLRIERDDEMYRPHVNEEAENRSRKERDVRLRMVRCHHCSMKVPANTCWAVRGYEDDATAKQFCCIDCMARWVAPRAGLRLHTDNHLAMGAVLDIIDECTDRVVLESIRYQIDNSLALL